MNKNKLLFSLFEHFLLIDCFLSISAFSFLLFVCMAIFCFSIVSFQMNYHLDYFVRISIIKLDKNDNILQNTTRKKDVFDFAFQFFFRPFSFSQTLSSFFPFVSLSSLCSESGFFLISIPFEYGFPQFQERTTASITHIFTEKRKNVMKYHHFLYQ